jgi:glycosyltransferase involved in cell wall biosynthesis
METKQNSRLTILLNGLSARGGGVQTYLINLLRFLPEETPADIFVLAPDSLALPTDRENIKRIPVDWPVENPFVRAAWEKIYLPKLLRKVRADVLFCPGGIIGASLPPGCKSVAMFRNMLPFDPLQHRNYPLGYMRMRHWILEKVLLKSFLRADLVIFISEFARKVIEDRASRRITNTVVIPHGISPSFRNGQAWNSPRPDWLLPEGYLLYVSKVDFYKAQLEVVQAYALLKQRRPTREKLVFAGPEESPEYGRKVRAEIHRLGLDEDVVMAGQIPYEQMPELYHHAKANIFASQCENCPNILLEALAAGRPVLASNRPPMPEFAGDAAVYFDPTSPADLAEKLAWVLEDPDRMRELSAKARERSSRYDWAQTAAATWKVIEGLSKDGLPGQ